MGQGGHPHQRAMIPLLAAAELMVSQNAGILRDKSFKAMTDKEWDIIHDVHVRGAYSCAHACWPVFRKNKFGRIINTSSAAVSLLLRNLNNADAYVGHLRQLWPRCARADSPQTASLIASTANYSAAKLGLVSFARTLAREGAKYNIHANAIAPIAASQLTATIMPPEMLEKLNPELFIPLVIYLCHERCVGTV